MPSTKSRSLNLDVFVRDYGYHEAVWQQAHTQLVPFVDLVVPILQKTGSARTEDAARILREHMGLPRRGYSR